MSTESQSPPVADAPDAERSAEVQAASAAGFLASQPAANAIAVSEETAGSVATEIALIRGAFEMAVHRPRDERRSFERVLRSCARPSFAENAEYSIPRGGSHITGPTVHLAREFARCWGNVQYGYAVVSEDEERIGVRGRAIDLETNLTVSADHVFRKSIPRKRGDETVWIRANDHQLRELTAKNGALVVRNALFQLLPRDLVDEACGLARSTVAKAAAGDLTANREMVVRGLVRTFASFDVSIDELERWLGCKIGEIDAAAAAELKRIGRTIRDGAAKPSAYFGPSAPTRAEAESSSGEAEESEPAEKQPAPKAKAADPAPKTPDDLVPDEDDARSDAADLFPGGAGASASDDDENPFPSS